MDAAQLSLFDVFAPTADTAHHPSPADPKPEDVSIIEAEAAADPAPAAAPPVVTADMYSPPSGEVSRAAANLAALRIVKAGRVRDATADELAVLARWSGWGALPKVFDSYLAESTTGLYPVAQAVRAMLTTSEWAAAADSTLNAHYTSPAVARAVWRLVESWGFGRGHRVLEPGCGSGVFAAAAPAGVRLVGVEKEPITARICSLLHPRHDIRCQPFESFHDDGYDLVVGNVPFGDWAPHDPEHNPERRSIHNYFIAKSLAMLRPGGVLAVVTSTATLDSKSSGHRTDIYRVADFLGAVRLPNTAFSSHAGTKVTTDVVVFRRRDNTEQATSLSSRGGSWVSSHRTPAGFQLSGWYIDHPELILGRLEAGGMYSSTEGHKVVADGDLDVALPEALDRLAALAGRVAAPPVRVLPSPVTRPEPDADAEGLTVPLWAKNGSLLATGTKFRRVTQPAVPHCPMSRLGPGGRSCVRCYG